jgi:hypothetical protein
LDIVSVFLLTALVALFAGPSLVQEPPVPPQETKAGALTFFSGSVVAVSATEITIRRRAMMSDATTKTFAMDAETKVVGKVRVKAAVTVRYVTDDEGTARAIQIIVR